LRTQKGLARLLVVTLLTTQTIPELSAVVRAASTDSGAAPVIAAASTPPPEAPRVTVKRTPRPANSPSWAPHFSATPTVDELREARVFHEGLVVVGRTPSVDENRALARVIREYVAQKNVEAVQPFRAFVARFPQSSWRASIDVNLGDVYRDAGYLSRALDVWEETWQRTRLDTSLNGRAVANHAVGAWCELATKLGRLDQVEQRLIEVRGRDVGGVAAAQLSAASMQIAVIREHPEETRWSGADALAAIVTGGSPATTPASTLPAAFAAYRPSGGHESAALVQRLASRIGMTLRMVKRVSRLAPIPVPSLAHLRSGRFVAVLPASGGRYVVRDPGLGGEREMTRAALEDESSGAFLITTATDASAGFTPMSETEASMLQIPGCPPGNPTPDDGCDAERQCCSAGGNGGGGSPPPDAPNWAGEDGCASCGDYGMATYDFHPLGALRLTDTPLGYTPPRGPAVMFRLHYNHRLSMTDYSTSHVGRNWGFEWSSAVYDPTPVVDPPYLITGVRLGQGGVEHYGLMDSSPYNWRSRAQLVQVSTDPVRIERRLPDGSVEVFDVPDRPIGVPGRQVLIGQVIDPFGQSLHFTYDAQFRLTAVTDALGQVTTLSYELAADPHAITKVTDPFGRSATLTYDAAGHLSSVTDVIGLTSQFVYGTNDFIDALVTPYGRTTFRHESTVADVIIDHWMIEATDPLGGIERLEWHWTDTTLPTMVPASEVPTGFEDLNEAMNNFVTYYWSKRAMALAPGDVTKARQTRWNMSSLYNYGYPFSVSVPRSVKRPLQGRVWYRYPAAPVGSATPIAVGRVIDGSASQIFQATYNDLGYVTSRTDPLGRRTAYTYAPNGFDVLEIRQTTGSLNDLLATNGNYTATHLPETVTDAAGQTATVTYNGNGQPLTVTNARNETTTYVYDTAGHGYLQSMTGPVAGSTVSYTYDSYGRLRTSTDSDGFARTYDYDALNRVTRVTYPDGSYEQTVYDKLDPVEFRDRLGRVTRTLYDPLRRVVSVRDPLGRTISQQWCVCGSLDALIDGKKQTTRWERDLAGRVTREVRADDVTATAYTYEPLSGRLKTVTDPLQHTKTYTYNVDNSVQQVSFAGGPATPSVSYTYESAYKRLATMVDGQGTTTYTYKPSGTLGAGEIATVDGPLTDDTISYVYDELGRVVTRSINGIANQTTTSYDALGRVTTEANGLGSFSYTYDGVSERVASVQYPNGQSSVFAWFGNTGDRRLQTLHHKRPGGATLSKSDYTYDTAGHLVTWHQQADADPATEWRYGYDQVDQLVTADKWSTTSTPAVLKRYAYGFDLAENRTTEQIDEAVTFSAYDKLNRLVTQQPGGAVRIAGMVNEAATVKIQGRDVAVAGDGRFSGTVQTAAGTNTFNIQATDASGNTQLQQYQFDVSGPSRTLMYDTNGQLTSDGSRAFEWNAANQLTAITSGSHRSELYYDGNGRRVRVVEKEAGVTQTDRALIWCDGELCEERTAGGSTVTRRFFSSEGEEVAGVVHFFTVDHLGSVTEATDATGTLLARYTYDAWGRRTLVSGTDVTDLGYAGLRWQANANLWMATYRAYDPTTARWISDDPIGFGGGLNLQEYVGNSPLGRTDPDGLDWFHKTGKEKNCGQGCIIRIDYTLQDGRKIRHLYWECKGKKGQFGENGADSHGQTWQDAPQRIRDCAERHGFRVRPQTEQPPVTNPPTEPVPFTEFPRVPIPTCGPQCRTVIIVGGVVIIVACAVVLAL
jgi:RHS repeat-associated protein